MIRFAKLGGANKLSVKRPTYRGRTERDSKLRGGPKKWDWFLIKENLFG